MQLSEMHGAERVNILRLLFKKLKSHELSFYSRHKKPCVIFIPSIYRRHNINKT